MSSSPNASQSSQSGGASQSTQSGSTGQSTEGNGSARSMSRQQITEQLNSGVVSITYQKANGESVTRPGTLMESKIPPSKFASPGQDNGEAITYFDLKQNEYRSFSISSLTSMSPES